MELVLGTALIAAFLLSNLALRPLEQISLQLDYWTASAGAASEAAAEEEAAPPAGYGGAGLQQDRTHRPAHAQRGRGLLRVEGESGPDSAAICRTEFCSSPGTGARCWSPRRRGGFSTWRRGSLLGLHAREIFDRSTVLGKTLLDAFEAGRTLVKEEVQTETWRRIEASLDFIHDDRTSQGLGALVTLHDLESVEEIESELELSRRMAAIGRLTSGVGHEVKNPINAIVVHLELLKTKLGDASAPGHPPSGGDRRRDSSPRPRGADAGGLLAPRRVATARAGSAPGHRRRAGAGRRGALQEQCDPGQPAAGEAAGGQSRRGPAQAGGAQRDSERRAGHAGGRHARGDPRRGPRRSRSCASPTRVRASPTRFGRRSSTSTSPPRAEAAESVWR